MTVDTTTPRTRRAIVMGAIGGIAALAANAVARPLEARAADPNDVVLGMMNVTTSVTTIQNTANGETAFEGTSTDDGIGVHGSSTGGPGVRGNADSAAGVEGLSTSSTGVYGFSASGTGVFGTSTNGYGVHATSNNGSAFRAQSSNGVAVTALSEAANAVAGATDATSMAAILGHSRGNSTAIFGYSSSVSGEVPDARAKTGVYGQADQDSGSRGVWGQSQKGQGVRGQTSSGRGVHGQATTGVAVSGTATTGYALATDGRVKLDKSAGQATIAAGTSSVTVTPGIDLTSTSAVVATLNGDPGGSTVLKRVAIDTAANTFTIHLTGNTVGAIKAAWVVLG